MRVCRWRSWTLLLLLLLPAACGAPTPAPTPFRSDRFHLEVILPVSWAAAEGPEVLARPFSGLAAFNSWGQAGFWAPEARTGEGATYSPQSTLGQVPDGEAYVALIHFSGGPPSPASEYGPEHEPADLQSLWGQRDCREAGGATWANFYKWGRLLRLEVYCRAYASDAMAAAVYDLLDSWRFDRVPVGDPGWASVQARSILPAAAIPSAFPIVSNLPVEGETAVSSESRDGEMRSTRAEVRDDTVFLTFQYRWGDPAMGGSSDECPPERCHWWRSEARPSGEVVLTEEGGAGLPSEGVPGTPPPPTATTPFAVQTPTPIAEPVLSVAEYPLTELPAPESDVLSFAGSVEGDPLALHAAEREEQFPDRICLDPNAEFCAALDGDRLAAYSDYTDPEAGYAVVTRNGQPLYRAPIGPSGGLPGLWGLWAYDGHWAVETALISVVQSGSVYTSTAIAGDVAVDGQSLNERFGYEETLGFQTLGGKPFYFFKRQGKTDANFAGADVPLGYDEVPRYYCCSAAAFNPKPHPQLVTFYGRRGDTWYYGEIGVSFSVAVSASASLDEGKVIFGIPVGPDGVQYGAERTGPMALAVAPGGTFWIADTQGSRLLHHDPDGKLLNRIDLSGYVTCGAADVEVTGSDILVLCSSGKVLRLTADGKVLATYDMPEGLGPEGGLTGLAVGDHGEILLEFEMGAEVAQLVNAEGVLEPARLPGYPHEGLLYQARLAGWQKSQGTITAGSTRIEVTVTNELAGLWLLGFTPDRGLYAVVEEMVSTPAAQVDQTVRHYSLAGELLGLARVPIAEQYTYVQHGLAVGPDGGVYALLTHPDHVQIVRLVFSDELEPILPTPVP